VSAARKPRAKKDSTAAARSEGSGEPRSVEVRGIKFTLPDEVPFSVMLANRKLLAAAEEENEGALNFALLDIAEAYVGAEQLEQFAAMGLSAKDGGNAVEELLKEIRKEFGIGEGESSASSDS
jgi:hypothetical protein